jgi:hypothetical protein
LLEFFEKSETAEFDGLEFSKIQEMEDERDRGRCQAEEDNRI